MDVCYTLDKLVMYLKVPWSALNRILHEVNCGYGQMYGNLKSQRDSNRIGDFRYNYVFETADSESYFFGVQPNWEPPNKYSTVVKLEFNPAKIGCSQEFYFIHSRLLSIAKFVDFKRFDVAMDFPVLRENCFLIKDQRMYKLFQNSNSDKTEYLGQRSQHGHVKLYNKQLEGKLNYPLTRLEITMDYENCSFFEFQRLFPEVYIFDDLTACFDLVSLSSTERVLFMACVEHPEYLKMLDFKKRKKIECILGKYTQNLVADEINYKTILAEILDYGKLNMYNNEPFEELETVKTPFDNMFKPVQYDFNMTL